MLHAWVAPQAREDGPFLPRWNGEAPPTPASQFLRCAAIWTQNGSPRGALLKLHQDLPGHNEAVEPSIDSMPDACSVGENVPSRQRGSDPRAPMAKDRYASMRPQPVHASQPAGPRSFALSRMAEAICPGP